MKRHRFNRVWQRKSHKERSGFLRLLEKTLSTNFLGCFGGSVVLMDATRAGYGTVLNELCFDILIFFRIRTKQKFINDMP